MGKSKYVAIVKKASETWGDDPERLIRELRRMVRAGKRSGDYLLVGAAYCALAETCNDTGDLSGILSNALKAVALLKDSGEFELIAKSYTALGKAYTNQEDDQMALITDEFVYEIVKKHRIKGDLRCTALNNLASSYHVMGDIRKAIRYQCECIEMAKKCSEESDTDIALYSLNLAEYYKDNGEPDAAREVLQSMVDWIDTVPFGSLVCDYYLRCALLS